jgi:hypothetical protein
VWDRSADHVAQRDRNVWRAVGIRTLLFQNDHQTVEVMIDVRRKHEL